MMLFVDLLGSYCLMPSDLGLERSRRLVLSNGQVFVGISKVEYRARMLGLIPGIVMPDGRTLYVRPVESLANLLKGSVVSIELAGACGAHQRFTIRSASDSRVLKCSLGDWQGFVSKCHNAETGRMLSEASRVWSSHLAASLNLN